MPFSRKSKHIVINKTPSWKIWAFPPPPFITEKQQNSISSLDVVDQIMALTQKHGFPRPLGKLMIQTEKQL